MNARLAFALLAGLMVATLALAFVLPAFGQSGGIQVNDADATRTESASLASGLNTVLDQVSLRIVTQYSNALRYFGLAAPSPQLQTLLGQVMPRVVFDHAASSRTVLLPGIPTGLQSVLEQAALRVIFQYAAAARKQPLVYPKALIGDGIPPIISGVAAAPDVGGIKVTWKTDEWADSIVVFGTQSGVYPESRSDPLYVKDHAVLLTGLAPGVYYYRVKSHDQSGNLAQSAEGSFTVSVGPIPRAYLPIVVR